MIPTEFHRFMSKVHIPMPSGCWLWLGAADKDGYGRFHVGSGLPLSKAHRFSFEHFIGEADGKFICHACDNPSCVNPAHLFRGTNKDNMRDASIKKRTRNGNSGKIACKRGHLLTGFNLYVNPRKQRICRTCANKRKRDVYVKR
jgi:hypothetical protein